MQLKVVHTLILGIVAWNMCGVELRLCQDKDRIVFPVDDDDEPTKIYNISSSSSTESTLNSSTVALDELHPLNSSATTTELPTLDNRILLDTLPSCLPGYKLRAGRCRKSA